MPEAPDAADPTQAKSDATVRAAGRGGLAIAVAKVTFIALGFVQQIALQHILGGAGYGEFTRALIIVSVINNVLVTGSIQGVSRSVSASPGRDAEVLRHLLRYHFVLALVVALVLAGASFPLARVFSAPSLALHVQLLSAIVFCYGVYATLVGSLNGRRRFLDQAGLDIFYTVSRTACMVGGAFLMIRFGASGPLGALLGFVVAAVLIVPVATLRSGIGKPGESGIVGTQYLVFLAPVLIAQLGLNLLMQTDHFVLSYMAGRQATAAGLGPDGANAVVGFHRGAQLFALLPYQLLMAVQFVLFPMLAKAHAERDQDAIRRYVRTGVRVGFIVTGLLVAPIASIASHILRFASPPQIAEGAADALRLLAPAMGAFAILGICCTALASVGRERTAALLTWGAMGIVAVAVRLAIPTDVFGKTMVDAAVTGTLVGMGIAACVGGVVLFRATGAFGGVLTIVRVAAAIGLTVLAGTFMPWFGKLLVPLQALAMGIVYVAILTVSGELSRADLQTIATVAGRKRRGA